MDSTLIRCVDTVKVESQLSHSPGRLPGSSPKISASTQTKFAVTAHMPATAPKYLLNSKAAPTEICSDGVLLQSTAEEISSFLDSFRIVEVPISDPSLLDESPASSSPSPPLHPSGTSAHRSVTLPNRLMKDCNESSMPSSDFASKFHCRSPAKHDSEAPTSGKYVTLTSVEAHSESPNVGGRNYSASVSSFAAPSLVLPPVQPHGLCHPNVPSIGNSCLPSSAEQFSRLNSYNFIPTLVRVRNDEISCGPNDLPPFRSISVTSPLAAFNRNNETAPTSGEGSIPAPSFRRELNSSPVAFRGNAPLGGVAAPFAVIPTVSLLGTSNHSDRTAPTSSVQSVQMPNFIQQLDTSPNILMENVPTGRVSAPFAQINAHPASTPEQNGKENVSSVQSLSPIARDQYSLHVQFQDATRVDMDREVTLNDRSSPIDMLIELLKQEVADQKKKQADQDEADALKNSDTEKSCSDERSSKHSSPLSKDSSSPTVPTAGRRRSLRARKCVKYTEVDGEPDVSSYSEPSRLDSERSVAQQHDTASEISPTDCESQTSSAKSENQPVSADMHLEVTERSVTPHDDNDTCNLKSKRTLRGCRMQPQCSSNQDKTDRPRTRSALHSRRTGSSSKQANDKRGRTKRGQENLQTPAKKGQKRKTRCDADDESAVKRTPGDHQRPTVFEASQHNDPHDNLISPMDISMLGFDALMEISENVVNSEENRRPKLKMFHVQRRSTRPGLLIPNADNFCARFYRYERMYQV